MHKYKKFDLFIKHIQNHKLTYFLIVTISLLLIGGSGYFILLKLNDQKNDSVNQSQPPKLNDNKRKSPSFFSGLNPLFLQKREQKTRTELEKLANLITVKILLGNNQASGFLIANEENKYQVLTNAHVTNTAKNYQIKTSDKKIHSARLINQGNSQEGNDLAILEFNSEENYTVANLLTLSDSKNYENEQKVFVVGFPLNSEKLFFSEGKISYITQKPLKGGYQIGYTNETVQGMSGGPVLNDKGEVIAIHGTGAFPILDNAYTYQDGDRPKSELINKMKQFSFGIPIEKIEQLDGKFAINPSWLKPKNIKPDFNSVNQLIQNLSETADSFIVKKKLGKA